MAVVSAVSAIGEYRPLCLAMNALMAAPGWQANVDEDPAPAVGRAMAGAEEARASGHALPTSEDAGAPAAEDEGLGERWTNASSDRLGRNCCPILVTDWDAGATV